MRTMRWAHLILFFCGAFAIAAAALASNPADVQRLRETRSCQACDLSNAELAGAYLRGVDVTDANLSGAALYKADLQFANLTGANLSGADLSGANLRGARGGALAGASTDEKTICPGGDNGPCS